MGLRAVPRHDGSPETRHMAAWGNAIGAFEDEEDKAAALIC
jgi:hypothetical protein